jgi:integrase
VEYAFAVLERLLAFAVDRRIIPASPITKAGKLYSGSRAEIVWSIQDELRAMDALPAHLGLALQIGIWTGQRPSDILAMRWDDYDGQTIRVKQSKTGRRLTIPVAAPLRALLDATPRRGETIVVGERGRPITKSGFDKMFRLRVRAAGVEKAAIGDTRGTAVTRLRASGCTVPEITAITGHSSADVNRILARHYSATDPELALNAIRKLESRFAAQAPALPSPDRAPNRPAITADGRDAGDS